MDHLLTVAFDTQDSARAAFDCMSAGPGRRWRTLASSRATSRRLRRRRSDGAVQDDDSVLAAPGRRARPLDGRPGAADATAGSAGRLCRRVSAALQPGPLRRSALTNGIDIDPLLAALGRHERLMRCDLGDGGGEALRDRIAPDAGRSAGLAAIGLRQLPVARPGTRRPRLASGRPGGYRCRPSRPQPDGPIHA